jgi:hypothetical protein
MHDPSNRFVVIISALLTLLVLGGATLAVGFRNGWLHVGADASSRDAVTALAQLSDAERSPTVPTARDAKPPHALEAADQSEAAVYTQKLEEAYRALDGLRADPIDADRAIAGRVSRRRGSPVHRTRRRPS